MDFEIRKDRGAKGPRLTREREAYFHLMRQGYRSREACRIVGIDVRTGKRWRNAGPTGANRGSPTRWS